MTKHYHITHIQHIFKRILQTDNSITISHAEKQIQELEKCDNFVQEMMGLCFRKRWNYQFKIMAVSLIGKYLDRKLPFNVSFSFISTLLHELSQSDQIGVIKYLLKTLNKTDAYARLHRQIGETVLAKIQVGEISSRNKQLILIISFIMDDEQNMTNNWKYISKVWFILLQIGFSLIQQKEYLYLSELIALYSKVAMNYKYLSVGSVQMYYSHQLVNLVLAVMSIHEQATINKQQIQMLTQILSFINLLLWECSIHNQQMLAQFILVKRLPEIIHNCLPTIDRKSLAKTNSQCINNYLRLCEQSFKILSIRNQLSPFFIKIVELSISALGLTQQQYDDYYHNPQQFIAYLTSCFDEEQPYIDLFDQIQNQSREQSQLFLGQTACRTLLQICKNQQQLTLLLIDNILSIVQKGIGNEELSYSTSLILVAVLKTQIIKRPVLHKQVQSTLSKLIKQSQIPTKHTEQPTNIHFTILYAVAQHYFKYHPNPSFLFHITNSILHKQKIEASLFILAINTLQQYYQLHWMNQIFNTLTKCLTANDSLLLSKTLKLIAYCLEHTPHQILLQNYQLTASITVCINSILVNVKSWFNHSSIFLVGQTVNILILQYKNNIKINNFGGNDAIIKNMVKISKLSCKYGFYESQINIQNQFIALMIQKIQQMLPISQQQFYFINLILQTFQKTDSPQLQQATLTLLQLLYAHKDEVPTPTTNLTIHIILQQIQLHLQTDNSHRLLHLMQLLLIHRFVTHDDLQYISNIMASIFDQTDSDNKYIIDNLLIILLALYGAMQEQINDESNNFCTLNRLVGYMTTSSTSRRTNQLNIILLSNLMQLVTNYPDTLLRLFRILIALVKSQIEWNHHQMHQIDDSVSLIRKKQQTKVDMDQWAYYKNIINRLGQLHLLNLMCGSLSGQQVAIFKKSLLCHKVDGQTRIIYSTKAMALP